MSESKRSAGDSDRPRMTTRRGYAVAQPGRASDCEIDGPTEQYRRSAAQRMPLPQPDGASRPRRRRQSPPFEISLVHEMRESLSEGMPWCALEIWTLNRVYAVDSSLVCIDVVDRATGKRQPGHSIVGARLSGGHRRDGGVLQLAHPFPVPGTQAVFRQAGKRPGHYAQTSVVERVVIRVRVTTVDFTDAGPTWDRITGRLETPAGPHRRR